MIAGAAPVSTARLRGGRTQAEDLDPWSAMLLDDEFSGDEWPYGLRTPEYALQIHDKDLAHWERFGFGPWSIRERGSGAYVGRAGLDYTRASGQPEVQVGWIIAPAARGRGYATEIAREALRVAFEVLELDGVVALITPENTASRAVAEKLAFEEAGVVEHHDMPHLLLRLTRGQ